jgi:hypothetical protein
VAGLLRLHNVRLRDDLNVFHGGEVRRRAMASWPSSTARRRPSAVLRR